MKDWKDKFERMAFSILDMNTGTTTYISAKEKPYTIKSFDRIEIPKDKWDDALNDIQGVRYYLKEYTCKYIYENRWRDADYYDGLPKSNLCMTGYIISKVKDPVVEKMVEPLTTKYKDFLEHSNYKVIVVVYFKL